MNHRLQQLGRYNHGFADPQTTFHDPPLDDRQFFQWAFDPKIPTRNEYDVASVNDVVDCLHRALSFDLRDDRGVAAAGPKHPPELVEIFLSPGEAQGYEVHSQFDPKLEILKVLLG
jgi:hypothetical protein